MIYKNPNKNKIKYNTKQNKPKLNKKKQMLKIK